MGLMKGELRTDITMIIFYYVLESYITKNGGIENVYNHFRFY